MTASIAPNQNPQFSYALPLLKAGNFEVRMAQSQAEIEEAQRLRYEVFYEECGAKPDAIMAKLKRDVCTIDDYCDVLLVIDNSKEKIVGTYRFMLRENAERYGGYYTASEYEIEKLLAFPGQIMELGRSCVHKDYRNKPTMQLLWRGIGTYIRLNQVELCFGCASFIGTDVEKYKQALSYLYYHHLAPPELRARVLPGSSQPMNLISKEAVDQRQAMRELPPLVKGYLRLGAYIGEGAFIDHQFNSLDVCIIVPRERMTDRYSQKYGQLSDVDREE